MGGKMALPKTQRRNFIREYASQKAKLVKNGSICSAHAMVDIWDNATHMYIGFNNDEESYVEDVAYVLAGVGEWATGSDGTQVGRTIFNDSGFKQKFQDGSNQVQHFAAGVAAGFQYGRYAWIGHRIIRPDSPQDTALNDASTWLGANLNGIGTSLTKVKQYIIQKVCEAKCGICNNGQGR